jgi:hypothetical protein
MLELILTILKVLGLVVAFVATLFQERHEASGSVTRHKPISATRLLAAGLLVAIAAEVIDFSVKHEDTVTTLKRHDVILQRLERTTHPFFPVIARAQFQLPLDTAEQFRTTLERAITKPESRPHDLSLKDGVVFEDERPVVRFSSASYLFPRDGFAKRLLEEPIGITIRFAASPHDLSPPFKGLILETFQLREPTLDVRLSVPRQAHSWVTTPDEGQYKSSVFEYDDSKKRMNVFLNDIRVVGPAMSDTSMVSSKDLEGKTVQIEVQSDLKYPRPSLVLLNLRFNDGDELDVRPTLTAKAEDPDIERDIYTCKITGSVCAQAKSGSK